MKPIRPLICALVGLLGLAITVVGSETPHNADSAAAAASLPVPGKSKPDLPKGVACAEYLIPELRSFGHRSMPSGLSFSVRYYRRDVSPMEDHKVATSPRSHRRFITACRRRWGD